MIKLTTYNGSNAGAFYIQSKGEHAGRPLKTPIANCFVVETDVECAFEIVYSMFTGGKFQTLILGSAIPFIRLREAQELLSDYFKLTFNIDHLKSLDLMDQSIENYKLQIEKMKTLKKLTARKILGNGY